MVVVVETRKGCDPRRKKADESPIFAYCELEDTLPFRGDACFGDANGGAEGGIPDVSDWVAMTSGGGAAAAAEVREKNEPAPALVVDDGPIPPIPPIPSPELVRKRPEPPPPPGPEGFFSPVTLDAVDRIALSIVGERVFDGGVITASTERPCLMSSVSSVVDRFSVHNNL